MVRQPGAAFAAFLGFVAAAFLRRETEPGGDAGREARVIPTAVLVTRGDVDMEPILKSLPSSWPVVIWDNSERPWDAKVYGHFAALPEIETEYAYFQDDDAICPAQALLDAWEESEHADKVLLNERDGETPWISWGGICRRDLPTKAIDRFVGAYGWSDDVLLWCDVILPAFTPWVNVDLQDQVAQRYDVYRRENRMVMQPNHYPEQRRVKALCEALLV